MFVNDLFLMTKTGLRRDENGSLKIKTMTKYIITFVNETKMLVVDEVTILFFSNNFIVR